MILWIVLSTQMLSLVLHQLILKAASEFNISQVCKFNQYVFKCLFTIIWLCMWAYVSISTIIISSGPLKIEIKTKSWCKPKLSTTKYMDFFEAKAACSVNDKCSMFYDYRGRKYYYLCGEPTRIYTSSKGSIRYTIENGKYIMILLYVIYNITIYYFAKWLFDESTFIRLKYLGTREKNLD